MKKLLLFIALAMPMFCFAQTKSPSITERAKSGVKKYLYRTMKDYSSYKPVEWGKIEINRTNYLTSDRGYLMLDSAKAIRDEYELDFEAEKARSEVSGIDLKTDSIFLSYQKTLSPVRKKMKVVLDQINREEKAFKSQIIGYSIYHSYRGKNSYGAYVLGSDTFYLNKNFQVVDTDSANEEDEDY